jgi:hypothetical protein
MAGKQCQRESDIRIEKITGNVELYFDLLGLLSALAVGHVLKIHLLLALALGIFGVDLRHLFGSSKFRVVGIVSETGLRVH